MFFVIVMISVTIKSQML